MSHHSASMGNHNLNGHKAGTHEQYLAFMIPRSQTFRSPLLVLWISPENPCHILWLRSLGWGQSDYRWLNPRLVSKTIHFALTNEKLLNGAVVRPSCYTKIGLLLYEDRVAEGKYRNTISRQNHVYSKIIFPDLPGLWYSLNDIDIQIYTVIYSIFYNVQLDLNQRQLRSNILQVVLHVCIPHDFDW